MSQLKPKAWLSQSRKYEDLFDIVAPNEKTLNPDFWTDAFPVYAEPPAPNPTDRDAEIEALAQEIYLRMVLMGRQDRETVADAMDTSFQVAEEFIMFRDEWRAKRRTAE